MSARLAVVRNTTSAPMTLIPDCADGSPGVGMANTLPVEARGPGHWVGPDTGRARASRAGRRPVRGPAPGRRTQGAGRPAPALSRAPGQPSGLTSPPDRTESWREHIPRWGAMAHRHRTPPPSGPTRPAPWTRRTSPPSGSGPCPRATLTRRASSPSRADPGPRAPTSARRAPRSTHPGGPLLDLLDPLAELPGRRLRARWSAAHPTQLGVDHTVRFTALMDIGAHHGVQLLP